MSSEEIRKRFLNWFEEKIRLQEIGHIRTFHEGEVWWCSIGENVGVEINGKSERFTRPVVIFRKFSGFSFLAIPLTTQPHEGSWYVPFDFKERRQYAVLSQGRSLSVYRLTRRIGTLSRADYEAVKEGYRRLIFKEK